jgi:hypothetical protein
MKKAPIAARLAWPVLLAGAVFHFSGCASIFYTPSNADLTDTDTSVCDPQALDDNLLKGCRSISEGTPLKSAPPLFDVLRRKLVADPTKLSEKPSATAQFVFELTPVGLFAPLFGYPPRETVYTGRVELAITPPEAARRVESKFDFRVKPGETFTKTLQFNRTPGKVLDLDAPRFSPEAVVLSIRCRPRGCELTSTPPIVGPDGSIKLGR